MSPVTFDELMSVAGPHLTRANANWRQATDPGQRLAVTLRQDTVCSWFTNMHDASTRINARSETAPLVTMVDPMSVLQQ